MDIEHPTDPAVPSASSVAPALPTSRASVSPPITTDMYRLGAPVQVGWPSSPSWPGEIVRTAVIDGEQYYEVQPDAEGVLGYFCTPQLLSLQDLFSLSTDSVGSDSDDTDGDSDDTDGNMDSDSNEKGKRTGDSDQNDSHGGSDSSAHGDDFNSAGNVDDFWEEFADLLNFINCYFLQLGPQIALRSRRYELASYAF